MTLVPACLVLGAACCLADAPRSDALSADRAEVLIFDAARKELAVPTLQTAETAPLLRRALTADKLAGQLKRYCRLRLVQADHLATKDPASLDRRYGEVAAGVGEDRLDLACRQAARRALARLGLDRLRRALREHYLSEVAYPATLDDLVRAGGCSRDALTDPWGKPFGYQPLPAELFPDLPGQRYRLWCTSLGREPPDLGAELGSIRNLVSRIRVVGAARMYRGEPKVQIRLTDRQAPVRGRRRYFGLGDTVLDLKLVGLSASGIFLASPDVVIALPTRRGR